MLMGGLDEIFGEVTGSGTTSYFTDALGSTVALTDGSGATSAEFTYEPYGKNTKTGAGDTPFRYTGRDDDGTGLYYYRARYYHPQLARFVAEDPIGLAGGTNLYVYVAGSPLTYTDPRGTDLTFSLGIGGTVMFSPTVFPSGGASGNVGVTVNVTSGQIAIQSEGHLLVGGGIYGGIEAQAGAGYHDGPLTEGTSPSLTVEGAVGAGASRGGQVQYSPRGGEFSTGAGKWGWGWGFYGAAGAGIEKTWWVSPSLWDFFRDKAKPKCP
jgi:RHS repeat-associated protein